MPRTYYTLLVRLHARSPWQIEFGSWDQEDVEDERDAYKLCNGGMYRSSDLKIIRTDGSQAAIDDKVQKLKEPQNE